MIRNFIRIFDSHARPMICGFLREESGKRTHQLQNTVILEVVLSSELMHSILLSVKEKQPKCTFPLAWCLRKAASETNGGENCVGYSANSAAVRKCTVQGVGCKKMSTRMLDIRAACCRHRSPKVAFAGACYVFLSICRDIV